MVIKILVSFKPKLPNVNRKTLFEDWKVNRECGMRMKVKFKKLPLVTLKGYLGNWKGSCRDTMVVVDIGVNSYLWH